MRDCLELGLDEAGRGPALGPLVMCAVALDPKAQETLRTLGVRDSKAYGSSDKSRARRAELARAIETMAAFVGYEVCEVEEIDRFVAQGQLNELERQKAVALILRAPVCARIVADGRTLFGPLTKRFSHLCAENHAESIHVAVAAASICAKVKRDALFASIQDRYREEFGLLRGGGYVNAPTRAFVAEYVRRYGGLPPEARTRWPWPEIFSPLPSPRLR